MSADGIRWKKLREKAVIDASLHPNEHTDTCAPSVFWSVHEQRYVCYLRTWTARTAEKDPTSRRWIGRTTSVDFVRWTPIRMMEYRRDDGQDQLYLPNTFPYFRAPHIYLAITARLSDHRQVLTPEQARSAGIPKHSWRDTSDVVFMTSRGGLRYDRTFRSSYIRPGLGTTNWASRANFPVLGVVQTSPSELSLYVSRDYMTPDAHLRRYAVRLDGFTSVHAPYEGGEIITRPLRFEGDRLQINLSTSASGWIRCEVQDESGKPIPGFELGNCREMAGDEIARTVTWKTAGDVNRISNQPVRLRFEMKDADLFSFQFSGETLDD